MSLRNCKKYINIQSSNGPFRREMQVDERSQERKPKVLLGVTGSVAAVKTPLIVHQLLAFAEVGKI